MISNQYLKEARVIQSLRDVGYNLTKWDPKQIEWDSSICEYLCEKVPDCFDIWFDPNRFKYSRMNLISLITLCSKHFRKWWNIDKIIEILETYASVSEIIVLLCKHCSEYIEIWYKDFCKCGYKNINIMKCIRYLTPQAVEKVRILELIEDPVSPKI